MTDIQANESYRVALPEFEGPLDLLLHLCKTHEIEIVNIPIAFITEKYLEYLDVMQTLPVDVAADYLLMAATLAYLKSRELVPAPEPLEVADEEGEESALDPREELIRRLLEYQKYKNAAAQLGERPIEGRNIFGRGMEVEGDGGPAPLADHSVWKLIEAFGRLIEKAGPKVTHDVLFDRVSISARINQMIDKLEAKAGAFRFDELFDLNLPEPELRSQLVVTLLAILELARLKVIKVLASDDDETLFITQVEGAALEAARRAKVSSDAESMREDQEAAQGEASEDEGEGGGTPGSGGVTLQEIAAAEAAAAAEFEQDAETEAAGEDEDTVGQSAPAEMSGDDESAPGGGAWVPEDTLVDASPLPDVLAAVAARPGEQAPSFEDRGLIEDASLPHAREFAAEGAEDERMPMNERSGRDETLPEDEPQPDDDTLPENAPPPEEDQADERLPGSEVIPPGEPVTEGEVIPEGEPVSEGEVVPPGEVVPVAPGPGAPAGSAAPAVGAVSSNEESHEEA